jgi:hypothetical protein
MTPDPRRARLEELLLTGATQELTPAEAAERDELLAALPDTDPDAFERAAAALHRALGPPPEPLPAELAEKLRRTARPFAPPPVAPTPSPVAPTSSPVPRAWAAWSGWVLAAGLAGVLVYTNRPKPERLLPSPVWMGAYNEGFSAGQQAATARAGGGPGVAVGIESARQKLLQDGNAKAVTFVADKKGPIGNVVWSDVKQEGYLEVRGLPPVDPATGTYQLWIVDGERKDPNHNQPVDGGVFRVGPDGTAIVFVRPPIHVTNAVAFAITKEKNPGGVVVSTEEHLVVLAPKKG